MLNKCPETASVTVRPLTTLWLLRYSSASHHFSKLLRSARFFTVTWAKLVLRTPAERMHGLHAVHQCGPSRSSVMPSAPMTIPSPGQFNQVAVEPRVLGDHVAALNVIRECLRGAPGEKNHGDEHR